MHMKLFTGLTAVSLAATMAACGTTETDNDRDDRATIQQDDRGTAGTSGVESDRRATGTSGSAQVGAAPESQTGTAGQSDRTRQGGTAGSTPGGAPDDDSDRAATPRGQESTTGTTGRVAGDQDFVRFAAMANTAEIELGKLAQQRASSMEVKNFAQQMVDDHTKASSELKQAAGSSQAPTGGQLDAKHQQVRERLSKLTGAEFDREFMNAMVEDHRMVVQRFKQQASSGSGQLQSFAQKQLPTLQRHLEMAQKVQTQVRGGNPRAGQTGQGQPADRDDRQQPRGTTGQPSQER